MTKKDKVHNALEAVAAMNGVSVDEVRAEIEQAIQEAIKNPSPSVQQFWDAVPHEGAFPTADEAIAYLSSRIESKYVQ